MEQGREACGQGRAEAVRKREDHWRWILTEQRASRLSHAEFCRERAISLSTYFWWRQELSRRDALGRPARPRRTELLAPRRATAPTLVRVRIREGETAATPRLLSFIEVVLRCGRILRVPVGFEAEELRRLASILEGESC